MTGERNIFEDDKKLISLCEDYFHIREELKEKAKHDPEQTPTPTKLASMLKYDGEPLTIEEFIELQEFAENDFADFKLAYIEENASGFYDLEGNLKTVDLFTP